jgi:hAT family C-terminal dimerisation region
MFDNLPALSALSTLELRDELDTYLSADPEQVGGNTSKEVISWWYERRGAYPRLHRMALDYLTIPGT